MTESVLRFTRSGLESLSFFTLIQDDYRICLSFTCSGLALTSHQISQLLHPHPRPHDYRICLTIPLFPSRTHIPPDLSASSLSFQDHMTTESVLRFTCSGLALTSHQISQLLHPHPRPPDYRICIIPLVSQLLHPHPRPHDYRICHSSVPDPTLNFFTLIQDHMTTESV